MKLKIRNKNSSIKHVIRFFVIFTLIVAYIIGYIHKDKQILSELQNFFPKETIFQKTSDNPLILKVNNNKNDSFSGYIVIEKAKGWGGPLQAATVIDEQGIIKQVIIIDHKETPSYFVKILRHRFFEKFKGKKVSDPFILNDDIDTVSQATISAEAFTKAIRVGSHTIGKKIFNLKIKEEKSQWKFGINEIILFIIYALILIGALMKIKILRYVTLAAGFVFLGFYLNSSISIGNISSIFFGYFPSIKENTFWWLLVPGILLITFISKKNLYFSWLCPFGAMQEFTAKIGGINIRLSKKIIKSAGYLSYLLTWIALMIIFLTSNPALGVYEPFATLFGLEGIGIQWFILPIVILGSFVLPRFWCRFFCPVRVMMELTIKARRGLDKVLKGIKK